jgi:hypothetical protein
MSELDSEFAKGTIKLLSGLYLSPTSLEMPRLPAVAGDKTPQEHLAFQSRMADLRLRRAMEQRLKNQNELLDGLPQLLTGVEPDAGEPPDLSERFRPAPAPRRETPKWVEIEQKAKADEIAEKQKAKTRKLAIAKRDAEKSTPEFRERLQKSEAEGQRRALRRVHAALRK